MARPSKTSKPNASSGGRRRVPATVRETSGAGFEFEDLIAAWQLVKALYGEQVPGIEGVGTQLQAQVSPLGWHLDDLLLTSEVKGEPRRLAISAKGNQQVSASGLPSDFVTKAWDQWRDSQGPFNRASDGLALVTLGTLPKFEETWREVKNACSGSDVALTMKRIRGNQKQSRVFRSVQEPGGNASDEETIELIRRLHVLSVDLGFAHSETKNQLIAQCRRLLESGDVSEAEELWKQLVNVAAAVRLRTGTITLPDLWPRLRVQFGLRQHPDFEVDWKALSNITSDLKARIETELPSGYAVPRTAEKASFQAAVADSEVTVVAGESGCGKSALVKSVLDVEFPSWNQVWFGPEDLRTALSAARRGNLPLRHELSRILNATVKPKNVLVIDSAERIEATEFHVIREQLQAILPAVAQPETAWRVVVVTQTQGWVEGEETMLGGRRAAFVELGRVADSDVKLALLHSQTLGWLTGHHDTIAALTNLRTLGWVIRAGAALGSNAAGLASHTAIADRLWKYWTQGRADVQALMMRLARQEASFERSFALTDLDPADTAILTRPPSELPLRLNERTNRVEFEHDLAADWARFQYLKQVWTDTLQWTALAENPLWTNALRMLGQFLLRESADVGTAWDNAFNAAVAANDDLAGDILLDALCLDPEAERFLTDRLDLLLADNAKVFNRLFLRFHHIATVPTGGPMLPNSAVGLYIEARYRSIILERWWPLLRFLVAQRERLSGLVSSALARVIETWLTKTRRELRNGSLTPFRREMAEIALAMARTVQVEKGHRDIYLTREYSLYTAPLAGAADLPEEVGNWALELAGRRRVAGDVEQRITAVRREKALAHAKRLETDPEYKERQERLRRMPPSIGQFRERLPPWPLGARGEVDMDFRTACLKKNGLQPLMRARPELAAEILLALIIEDQPEREYGSHRFEMALGLSYPKDAYPTAFWKSPFFVFLQLAPDIALDALIALVNFSTERWVTETMRGREGPPPGVTLQFEDGSKKAFPGRWQVFGWPQTNSMRDGSLFCALDALERWLTIQLDAGEDITAIVERLLRENNSAALASVLINVAKYRPSLLTGALAPLLTFPNLFYWDSIRVEQVADNFVGLNWIQGGQAIFDFARDWTLAPHRQQKFLDVVVELLLANDDVARRLKALVSTWTLPGDPKKALEFKLFFAALDSANYRSATNPKTGAEVRSFVCPDDVSLEVQSWQSEKAQPPTYLLLPDFCERRLQGGQTLTDEEAEYLYGLIKTCEADTEEDEARKSTCKLAAAATLVVLGGAWLAKTPEAQTHCLPIVRSAISGIPSTSGEIRKQPMSSMHSELKFAAYAVMHLWLAGGAGPEWEADVLRLLTSGDESALATVIGIAYANRNQLGPPWWRLLQAGVLWSGLIFLTPRPGDDEGAERAWSGWLARLRRFPLRNKDANLDSLDFKRVASSCGRLEFYREKRLYTSGKQTLRGRPKRRLAVSLDGHVLEVVFGWLIHGAGTGDRPSDTRLALRIWDYDASCAKARAKTERNGEYDLPTQTLGYGILPKLAALSLAAPENEDRAVWEPVLAHGPAAHHALQEFICGLFQSIGEGDDTAAFERVWRAVAEYGLAADWSKPGLWFYGERLICDLLGFANEHSLARLAPGGALRMKDVYERWALAHLGRDEECVTRFSHFLTTTFGGPLRLDGLRWIAAMLKAENPSDHWYREGTDNALVELVASALGSDAHALSKDAEARQALVEVAAVLAAKNIPEALTLQERIRLL